MGRPKKEPQTLATKVQKEMPEFVSEVVGLDVQALKNRIAKLANDLEDSEQSMEDDEELKETKEAAKEMAAPYREFRTASRLKTRYLLSLVKEKGGN
jgi:hypothetical protein